VSLSGNLGFVSLDEVLRLLTRSSQQGSVDVRGEQIRGRIFITKGGIGLATTSDDEGLHRHLVKSGLVDDDYLSDIEAGNGSLSPIVEKSGGAIVELIREMSVESVYQLGLNGESFEVYEGLKSHYASPKAFELEELLTDSKQRLTDWAEVSRVVDDLKASVKFVRDLGDREEVKIDRESWKVLSEVGSGASVSEMADELGTTEFWTARLAARLIDKDLVAFAVEDAPAEDVAETYPEETSAEVIEEVAAAVVEEPATDWQTSEQAEDDVDEDVNPDQSWWQEPDPDSEEEASSEDSQDVIPAAEEQSHEDTDDVAEEQVAAAASQIPTLSANGDNVEVEEDTEAFLEKVFSELETPEEPEEEGYGLLRRRRMGAIRDLSGDA